MSERDWQKDAKLCYFASSPPWEMDHDGVMCVVRLRMGHNLAVDFSYYNDREYGEHLLKNICFIVEAREALPYWLQQVRELEDETKRLREVLVEVWCICRQRAPKNAKLLGEVKRVIGMTLAELEEDGEDKDERV